MLALALVGLDDATLRARLDDFRDLRAEEFLDRYE